MHWNDWLPEMATFTWDNPNWWYVERLSNIILPGMYSPWMYCPCTRAGLTNQQCFQLFTTFQEYVNNYNQYKQEARNQHIKQPEEILQHARTKMLEQYRR